MNIKLPENDYKYLWTFHSKKKILQYGLGPGLIKRIIRYPDRKEEAIAPKTIGVMRRRDGKSTKKELWVMYQKVGAKKRIISVWIYPGVSPKDRPEIAVPDEVWEELEKGEK